MAGRRQAVDRKSDAMDMLVRHLARLACPICYSGLRLEADGVVCVGCTIHYPIVDGLPVLIAPRAEKTGETA